MQRILLNPPMTLGVLLGVLPGHVLIETTGRRTGKRRRTVVGAYREESTLWVVAEQGTHAGYVRNLLDHPRVRVRLGGGWVPGHAAVLPDDDPQTRLARFGNDRHAGAVRRFGTALLTVRIDLDQPMPGS
ncbi:nitroreductase family deazaflavin-dependent oxidoreductase [Amycolatopsis sp. K13G38]|uniref:Nitroreductase family deazaflavin-dependent oxidoreductase n=2 Tax=Amycolatopsis acididurans TaxID=2724524 RepID=A0ABX1JES3_9PSEU|nr:nitroreductase family deazaflavin-dependent oxidoreductase [Amycolatopsis acididurans]